jgi:hypothetical protein
MRFILVWASRRIYDAIVKSNRKERSQSTNIIPDALCDRDERTPQNHPPNNLYLEGGNAPILSTALNLMPSLSWSSAARPNETTAVNPESGLKYP